MLGLAKELSALRWAEWIVLLTIAFSVGCSSHAAPSSEPAGNETSENLGPETSGEHVAVVPPYKQSPRAIRLATYNINWGNARLDAVVDAIRRADADVVCLQETNERSARILRREFAAEYRHIRFYGSTDRYLAGGFGVLSRWDIVRDDFLPPRHGLFGMCVMEIRQGDRRLRLIVVHLQPFGMQSKGELADPSSLLASLQEAEETREEEAAEILKLVGDDVPTVVAGDFNSCSNFKAPTLLAEHGLVDSFAAVHDAPDFHPTWHWPTKYADLTLRIDYIFHTPSIRTLDSQVIKTDGSDHYLLVSRLEIGGSEGKRQQ